MPMYDNYVLNHLNQVSYLILDQPSNYYASFDVKFVYIFCSMLGEVDVRNIDVIEMYDGMSCSTMPNWEDVLCAEGNCMLQ